jgi:hypothetical protein
MLLILFPYPNEVRTQSVQKDTVCWHGATLLIVRMSGIASLPWLAGHHSG